IIETAHEPRVQPMIDAEPIEPVAYPIEEMARRGVQVIRKCRSVRCDALVALFFRVEDAHWVELETPPTVLRQFDDPRREVGDERLAVGGAALRVPQGIQLEHDPITDPEAVEYAAAERDHLDVGLRLCHTDQL